MGCSYRFHNFTNRICLCSVHINPIQFNPSKIFQSTFPEQPFLFPFTLIFHLKEFHKALLKKYFSSLLPTDTPNYQITAENVHSLSFNFLYGNCIIGNHLHAKVELENGFNLLSMTSGTGKTKLLYELSNRGDVYVVWVSCAGKKQESWPVVDRLLEKYFEDKTRVWNNPLRDRCELLHDYQWFEKISINEILKYIVAQLKVLEIVIKSNIQPAEYMRFIMNKGSQIVNSLYQRLSLFSSNDVNWDKVIDHSLASIKQLNRKFLIAFDDSHHLLDCFQNTYTLQDLYSHIQDPNFVPRHSLYDLLCYVAYLNTTRFSCLVSGSGLPLSSLHPSNGSSRKNVRLLFDEFPQWDQSDILRFISHYIRIPVEEPGVLPSIKTISASLVGRPVFTATFLSILLREIIEELKTQDHIDFVEVLWSAFTSTVREIGETFFSESNKISEIHKIDDSYMSKYEVLYRLLWFGNLQISHTLRQFLSSKLICMKTEYYIFEPLILLSFQLYLESKGISLLDLATSRGTIISHTTNTFSNLFDTWREGMIIIQFGVTEIEWVILAILAYVLLHSASEMPITSNPLFSPLKGTKLDHYALIATNVHFDNPKATRLFSLLKSHDTSTILVTTLDIDLQTDIIVLLKSTDGTQTIPLTVNIKTKTPDTRKRSFSGSKLKYTYKNSSSGCLRITFDWFARPENPKIEGDSIDYLLTQTSPLAPILPISVRTSFNKLRPE